MKMYIVSFFRDTCYGKDLQIIALKSKTRYRLIKLKCVKRHQIIMHVDLLTFNMAYYIS
jgi:hypothetical protein